MKSFSRLDSQIEILSVFDLCLATVVFLISC
jgi:hypothetical protein